VRSRPRAQPTTTPDPTPIGRAAGRLADAAARLSSAPRVWVGTHVDPDGDAIGSLLGLGWILAGLGKEVALASQDSPPAEVRFLPGIARITDGGPATGALAVAVDAADLGRLGRLVAPEEWARFDTIVLDHHASNPGFGDVDVIRPECASTAEIVLALADALGAPVGPEAATCLLTGVVTDTIGFRTSSTTAETLDAARRLLGLGAPLASIMEAVFSRRPLGALRLVGRALERLEVRGRSGVTTLRQADLAELGVAPSEVRGVSSMLATAAELDAVGVLREREDGTVDVSLRARPGVDLLPAARALGGGGHPLAAGATLRLPLAEAARLVADGLAAAVALRADPETA